MPDFRHGRASDNRNYVPGAPDAGPPDLARTLIMKPLDLPHWDLGHTAMEQLASHGLAARAALDTFAARTSLAVAMPDRISVAIAATLSPIGAALQAITERQRLLTAAHDSAMARYSAMGPSLFCRGW